MPIEVKDLADFLGVTITADTTIDTVKEEINAKYVPTERHSTALGELNGKVSHAIKKGFKDIGVEIDPSELKDKNLTDLPSIFASKVKTMFGELESAKGLTAEQAEAKFKGDLDKYKKQLEDLSGLHEGTKNEFNQFKESVISEKRTGKIQGEFENVLKGLKFSEAASALAVKGFKADLNETFKFDLSEEGNPIVRDIKGELIKSKVKSGEPATYEEVIKAKFEESKLGAVIDSKKVPNFATTYTPPIGQNNVKKVAARH
jgi:hypothetical protein